MPNPYSKPFEVPLVQYPVGLIAQAAQQIQEKEDYARDALDALSQGLSQTAVAPKDRPGFQKLVDSYRQRIQDISQRGFAFDRLRQVRRMAADFKNEASYLQSNYAGLQKDLEAIEQSPYSVSDKQLFKQDLLSRYQGAFDENGRLDPNRFYSPVSYAKPADIDSKAIEAAKDFLPQDIEEYDTKNGVLITRSGQVYDLDQMKQNIEHRLANDPEVAAYLQDFTGANGRLGLTQDPEKLAGNIIEGATRNAMLARARNKTNLQFQVDPFEEAQHRRRELALKEQEVNYGRQQLILPMAGIPNSVDYTKLPQTTKALQQKVDSTEAQIASTDDPLVKQELQTQLAIDRQALAQNQSILQKAQEETGVNPEEIARIRGARPPRPEGLSEREVKQVEALAGTTPEKKTTYASGFGGNPTITGAPGDAVSRLSPAARNYYSKLSTWNRQLSITQHEDQLKLDRWLQNYQKENQSQMAMGITIPSGSKTSNVSDQILTAFNSGGRNAGFDVVPITGDDAFQVMTNPKKIPQMRSLGAITPNEIGGKHWITAVGDDGKRYLISIRGDNNLANIVGTDLIATAGNTRQGERQKQIGFNMLGQAVGSTLDNLPPGASSPIIAGGKDILNIGGTEHEVMHQEDPFIGSVYAIVDKAGNVVKDPKTGMELRTTSRSTMQSWLQTLLNRQLNAGKQ